VYKNLVAPLDGSPFAEHALPLALAIAARTGATLHLALVHTPIALPIDGGERIYDDALDSTLRDQETAYLDELVQRLAKVSPVPVVREVLDGPVADTLRSVVERVRADLVVMTTHGRGPLSRFWLGSIADQLIRRLPARLLLARPSEEATDLTRGPTLKRILIPLDGSAFAEQMIEPALALGALTAAEYTLVRVIHPIEAHFAARFAGPAVVQYGETLERRLAEMQAQARADAQAYLERAAESLRTRGFTVQTTVVSHGQPPVAILELAQSLSADLIALKTHGRHGIGRLVMGSCADKVLRGASIPVLL
jgi:nucleotide-binding universal stress UspA family protein